MRGDRTIRLLLGIALTALLTACTGQANKDLSLAYGQAVRDVGLFPVYPPREEFQIGDMYLWSQSVSDPNDTINVYLDTIEWLRGEADRFMASRIVFTNTDALDLTKPDFSEVDIPPGSSNLALRGEQRDAKLSRSLPIAAFPTVSADAGFTAGLGIVGALTALGLAGGERTTVTLDFNDVRTYWVPVSHVMRRVVAEQARIYQYFEAAEIELNRLLRVRRGTAAKPCSAGRRCGVSVVTRVFLTRQINYTYRNNRILAAAFRQSAAPAAASTTHVAAAPAVNIAVGTNTDGSIDSSGIDTQLNALRTQMNTLTTSNAEGVSFRFESWNARGVTFATRYQRPVVVGWDGVELGMQVNGGASH